MFNFTYNNFNSNDLKFFIESIPVLPSFIEEDNNITITFAYFSDDYEDKILRIKRIFNRTTGELSLSNHPNYFFKVTDCYFKEREKNKSYAVTEVTFQLEAYFYHNRGKNTETITTSKIITNPCIEGKPLIKIYPNNNGSCILKINANTIAITNIIKDKWIIIDSELKECYTETGFSNNYMNGDFPILKEGNNTIQVTGQISKIEIIPRWRS